MTTAPAFTIPTLVISTVPAFTALRFNTRATLAILAQFNNVPGLLYDDAARLGLTVNGPIQYVYEGVNGDERNEFLLTIALPIREPEPGTLSDGLSFQTLPAFRCAAYTYAGAWDTFPALYDALFPAFYRQGHTYTGSVREIYDVVDFERIDNCVTTIQIGM